MKNTVIEFIVKNGWIRHEENSDFQCFYKENNIGIDVSDDEIVLIDGRGDYLHIPIDALALFTLLGHMLHYRIIATDYYWLDKPTERKQMTAAEYEAWYKAQDWPAIHAKKEAVTEEKERHLLFVREQISEAIKTGRVTTRKGLNLPIHAAYRCYYCGEYLSENEAATHFGKSRSDTVQEVKQ